MSGEQIGVIHWATDEGAVEFVFLYAFDQIRGGVGFDVQAQPTVDFTETFQSRGKAQRGKAFHGADAELTDLFTHLTQCHTGLRGQLQDLAGVAQQHFAGW